MLTAKEKAEQRSILQQKRFFASRSAKVKFNLNQDEGITFLYFRFLPQI